jgi:endonuclease/exonuclease/phosphatase (EEP) superfamily protein YafD
MNPAPAAMPASRTRVSLWGLTEVTVAMALLVTVAGFLARLGWLLELTCHFRLQLGVVLAALALVGLAGRRRNLAVAAAVGAVVNLTLVLLAARPNSPPLPASTAPRLRLLSLNVHTANTRSDLVRDLIARTEPDLVLLLEVNAAWMREMEMLRQQYPFVLSEPREDNFGLALFARHKPADWEVIELGPADVPSVRADLELGGRTLRLLGTHPLPPATPAYAAGRNGQLRALAEWSRAQTLPVVLAGDLNVTPWSPHFTDLLRDGGLRRERPEWSLGVSWPTQAPWFGLPLDHCLTTPGVAVLRREVAPSVASDHWPLLVELAFRD